MEYCKFSNLRERVRNEDKGKKKKKKKVEEARIGAREGWKFRDYYNRVLVNLWNGVIGLGDHRSS